MPRLLCQDRPDLLELEAEVLDSRPGAVLVDRSPFFPGGGGQLPDRGAIHHRGGVLALEGATPEGGGAWLAFAGADRPEGRVLLSVDRAFRGLMCELHTVAHIVNSIVFQEFGGALLTGAQLAADGTLRVDFDLPGADNDRLRALDGAIAAVVRQDLAVAARYLPRAEAEATPGMFRSKAVAPPPQPDGPVRIVEIAGLDRQACGGTHLASTGLARPARILKVDNKGRHNRRVRVGLAGAPFAV
ncbi:MAG TPA: alanyl-tRNA editing protein [Alphaproteobacteria bacterium]|nr:alanyl-tRNA editing protein [Alphaproteobacteria bacterium]